MPKVIGYILGILLVSIAVLYFSLKPSGPNLPDDPLALEALNLVKEHPSRQAPNIEQAIAGLVEDLENKGRPFRKGNWRVSSQGPDTYVVSMLIREKGADEWIERDYAWRVNVKKKWIRVITLPATHIMPFHELPPLPHSQEISWDNSIRLWEPGLG